MTRQNFQRQLAQMSVQARVAPEGVPVMAAALLDTLAVSFAGSREPVVENILRYAESFPAGPAAIWLNGHGADAEVAALVNGVASHALDYDDVSPEWRGHPSAVLFPALLALGTSSTLRDIFEAYAVGYQTGIEIGRSIKDQHYRLGWHATSTVGVIAATAACARLLRFNLDLTVAALGIAAAQAAGTQENFGTMTKPLQAGLAAAAAVRTVRLAQLGISASDRALAGSKGFFFLYAGEGPSSCPNPDRDIRPADFLLERKEYPSCYASHRAIRGALLAYEEDGIRGDDVRSVQIRSTDKAHMPLLRVLPNNGDEAKFSAEYCVAAALVDGRVGLNTFLRDQFVRADLWRLVPLIALDEAVIEEKERTTEVTLLLRDGRLLVKRVAGLGLLSSVGPDASAAKLDDCLRYAGLDGDVEAILDSTFRDLDVPLGKWFREGPLSRVSRSATKL